MLKTFKIFHPLIMILSFSCNSNKEVSAACINPKKQHGMNFKAMFNKDFSEVDFERMASTNIHNFTDLGVIWPNKTVPYKISELYSLDEKCAIEYYLQLIRQRTCLKIRYANRDDRNSVYFSPIGRQCTSRTGMQGGVQPILLNQEMCITRRNIIHEFMHTLGFIHMHMTPVRDKYVEVIWSNILPDFKQNFYKFNETDISMLGEEYDYSSIMHYSSTAYSSNGGPTLLPLNSLVQLRTATQPSYLDIKRINLLYNCTSKLKGTYRN